MIKRNHTYSLPLGEGWGGVLLLLLLFLSTLAQAQIYNELDTLDEDDFMSLRDTVKMSRKNIALDEENSVYAVDYVIDDRYRVSHERFDKNLWYQWYVGGGAGFEFIQPRTEGFDARQLTHYYMTIGKQITPYHSLRMSLGGGFFYHPESDYWFARGGAKVDYLYDVSTHVMGYSSARPFNVSLIGGIGANVVNTPEDKLKFVPDLHFGMQFRILTGTRCFLNIEPYAGISADQLDMQSNHNWRRYDLMYGLNLNFQYYLDDPMSPQSKLRLLQNRGDGSLMVDRRTVDTWRTPWFFEATTGPAFNRIEGTGIVLGNTTTISAGRWLSPVLGLRLSAATRSLLSREVDAAESVSGFDERYHSHYNTGRIDFLLNPFGFSRNFSWDNQFGASIVLGAEIGSASYHDRDGQRPAFFGQSFSAGVHAWTKLTDDLQFFVEPRFTHSTYTRIGELHDNPRQFRDNLPSIDIGLTMMIRSEKFHELDEFDDVQNFMHSYVRGFRIGAAGGMSLLHLRDADYGGGGTPWNVMAYLEYRFSHLHSVRAMGHFVPLKRNALLLGADDLSSLQHNMLIASLDYQVSLTNLLSGTLRHRWCELEAYAGPSAGFMLSYQGYPGSYYFDNSIKWGFNGGLKLSKHIWNGISIVAMPTLYMLRSINTPGSNTVNLSGFRFYQSAAIGVQYKIGSVHRNAAKVRMKKLRNDNAWAERQQKKLQKAEQKQARRNQQRQQRYDARH